MRIVSFVLGIIATVMMALVGVVALWVYHFFFTDWDNGSFAPPNWGPWRKD